MKLSGKTTLNLYVNFLLESLPSNVESFFEVCDCNNFVVVKGETTHTEVINLIDLNKKFEEKYPETNLKSTIDLINYNTDFENKRTYEFIFYNTPNLNSNEENKNSLFTLSEFPWGSSWNQGKLLYFYFKLITYKIPSTYLFDWLKYKVSITSDNQIDFTIEDNFVNNQNDVLKSAILDCFDFNLHEFEKHAKKMDLENLILNPLSKESILDISVKDFIIV
jgi:hypothetical protein